MKRYENTDSTRVRYDQVDALLLNEFLEAHSEVEEQEATIAHLKKELQATSRNSKSKSKRLLRACKR